VFIAESKSDGAAADLAEPHWTSDANVLITGEHGTGKEVVAQTLTCAFFA